MSRLSVSTRMTVDGVIDSTDGWFVRDGEHERRGFEQLLVAEALLPGRKTYEGLAGASSGISDDLGWADRINAAASFPSAGMACE